MISDMTVGMENLPNVFIDKIDISKAYDGIKIIMLVSMYDHKENPSWYRRDLGLKLKIIFESRQEIIENLNEGVIGLHNVTPETQGRIIVSEINNPRPAGIDGDYEKYTIKFERHLKNEKNLNVYAACYIDDTGFGDHPIFSKFYGPMAAEQIYNRGQLNMLTKYFYYPETNEEYGGPVHQKPDGSYMEGSQHSNDPHENLRIVVEENYKIHFHEPIDFIPTGVETVFNPSFPFEPVPGEDRIIYTLSGSDQVYATRQLQGVFDLGGVEGYST